VRSGYKIGSGKMRSLLDRFVRGVGSLSITILDRRAERFLLSAAFLSVELNNVIIV
jgi:hypothetical protein